MISIILESNGVFYDGTSLESLTFVRSLTKLYDDMIQLRIASFYQRILLY